MRRILTLAPLALLACNGTNDFDGYDTLHGELTYSTATADGTVVRDVDLHLTGTTYTGPCSDCTFAFHVEPEIVEDRGTEACVLPSLWTYVDDDFIDRSGLGYAEATVDIDSNPMDQALVAVGQLEGRMTSAGVVSDAGPRSSVTWDASTGELSWSHSFVEAYGDDLLYDRTCRVEDLPELGGRKTDGAYVEDPDGCIVAVGDDVFRCTYAPTQYSCGGGRFTPDTTGSYRLLAGSFDKCTAPDDDGDGFGDTAAYRLSIDASYDPELTLEQDEAPRFTDRLTTVLDGQAFVSRGGK